MAISNFARHSCLQYRLQAVAADERSKDAALLVHCSGGVGRTGVFLAAYATLLSLAPLAIVDGTMVPQLPTAPVDQLPIEATVAAMRAARHPWMVEGEHQYAFCYEAALDELESREAELAFVPASSA